MQIPKIEHQYVNHVCSSCQQVESAKATKSIAVDTNQDTMIYAYKDNETGYYDLFITGSTTPVRLPSTFKTYLAQNDIPVNLVKSIEFVKPTILPQNSSHLFEGMENLTSIDLTKVNTDSVTDMSYMFSGCNRLKKLNLSNFKTTKVKNMSYMFNECSSLTTVIMNKFNTLNVDDMEGMFYKCESLSILDISTFKNTNSPRTVVMFFNCKILTTVYISEEFDPEGGYWCTVGCPEGIQFIVK